MHHSLLLLSLLPLLASAAPKEEAPVPYEYSISTINARSIGLLPRQNLVCPGAGYSKCPGDYCCRPGLRCDGNACCPIGRICNLPATCTSRSDPKCASNDDCCPSERPYCILNSLGGATCSDEPPLGGGGSVGGGSDDNNEELPPVPDFTTSTSVIPTTTSSISFDDFTTTRTRPTTTFDDFTTTSTSSSSSSSSSSLEDLFNSFTSSLNEATTRTGLPKPTDDLTLSGSDGASAGPRNVIGMAVVAGLGLIVGVAVML